MILKRIPGQKTTRIGQVPKTHQTKFKPVKLIVWQKLLSINPSDDSQFQCFTQSLQKTIRKKLSTDHHKKRNQNEQRSK